MERVASTAEYREAVELGRDLSEDLPPIDVDARLRAAQRCVEEGAEASDPFDALLVTDLLNIRALTGFTGSAARLLLLPGSAHLVTDRRYEERAPDQLAASGCSASVVVGSSIADQNRKIAELLADAIRLGLEDAAVSWKALRAYDETFAHVQLVPVDALVESLRRTKTVPEVARLARASAIADRAFLDVWERLGDGVSEQTVSALLEDRMRTYGASGPSFEAIIASGPNGSRPHHETGARVLCDGDAVICDFGALYDGYHSDTTRTVFVGEPSKAQLRHFNVVRQAQAAGVAMARAGVSGKVVDAACRGVIEAVGWGEQFSTGTGHGSGLQIHELPWSGKTSVDVLAHGDITTVEPGVYLTGDAGVRIEDSMVVTDDGPILLTRLPYELVL